MLFDLTALLVGLTEMMDVRLIKTLQRWPSRVLSCFPCRGLEGRCATRCPVSGLRLHSFPKTRCSASGSTTLIGNRMGGLIVALPRKEWGGSEGCSLPGKWKHSFDAKPVHSHFASFGYGSPGGFSCSLFGSWTPTPSSHLGNVVGRSQPCAI